jgi:GH24 family phage-related lysozyme (muramidase)
VLGGTETFAMSKVNRWALQGPHLWLESQDDPLFRPRNEPGASARNLLTDGIDLATQSILNRPLAPVPAAPRPVGPSIEALVNDLARWEGQTTHMYADTRGNVTVGIGHKLPSAKAAQMLPLVDARTGKPATKEQITAAFAAISQMPKGMRARAYASATTLRLPEAAARQIAHERLQNEFLPALRRLFPRFDGYPTFAQRALVDMIYSLGAGGLAKFSKLRAACEAGDWEKASAECSRSTSRPERNEWTREMLLEAGAGRRDMVSFCYGCTSHSRPR